MTRSDAAGVLAAARMAADAARSAILPVFRSNELQTDNKAATGFDPVTQADRAAEAAIRDVLAELAPQDALFGEEFGHKDGTSGRTWILDPIDGTRGFLAGTATWGVLIALQEGGHPVFGLIDQPYTKERWEGGLGWARFEGPAGVRVLGTRSTTALADAILFSTFPEIGTDAERAAFQRLDGCVKLTRYGCDCYAYGLLAIGQIDLVVEAGLQVYDYAAPVAVIEAAGGIVSDWSGGPAGQGGRILAASNRDIHAAALEALAWE